MTLTQLAKKLVNKMGLRRQVPCRYVTARNWCLDALKIVYIESFEFSMTHFFLIVIRNYFKYVCKVKYYFQKAVHYNLFTCSDIHCPCCVLQWPPTLRREWQSAASGSWKISWAFAGRPRLLSRTSCSRPNTRSATGWRTARTGR